MKPKKSIEGEECAAAVKVEQTSTDSKCPTPRRPIGGRIVQNVLLIWLDGDIVDNSTDCRNTISQLRRAVNTINTFSDGDQCIQFLETIANEKICMIISGSLGQHIVRRVHNMSQVDSIFIFCGNKKDHEQWAKEWSKIKGVFTEITPICEALKQAAQRCEQNAISMSFVTTSGDNSKKNLDQLDPSFMYTQILKEILLEIKFESKHFTEFIQYCREVLTENLVQLTHIKKLEIEYSDHTPIWWYTYECFLYPMLNRALRLIDVDIMIKMGFFIADLYHHIKQLHQEQFGAQQTGESFTVYRGQGMSKIDFDLMTKTKSGLISFNNFLSTSKDSRVSLAFAGSNSDNPDLFGIFFVMTIDPSISATTFASIIDVSYFQRENEVLFAMHTVFRIGDIAPMVENRLFQVELTLTSDNDKDLHVLTDRIREDTEGTTGWDQLGELLLKIGQAQKAQQVYQILLEQTSEKTEQARIYHQLGNAKEDQGEYSKALSSYEKALEIRQQSLPPNHTDLAKSYIGIGNVYYSMGEYSKALSSYEKALEIRQQSRLPNHSDLASSYIGIGNVYYSMGEYSKALSSYEKALEIRQQSRLPNHPDLAKCYIGIGLAYEKMGNYSKALSSHERALEIQKQSLPPSHPDLAMFYGHIGNLYSTMGQHSKAFSFCERTVNIVEQSLPANHPHLQWYRNNLEDVKGKL